ncbi:MAG TPA: hypothetical protein VF116_19570 [Ktedonobacterales bacterium]
MGNDEAMRDAFFALFGCFVVLHAWLGVFGVLGLRRLRMSLPPLGHRVGFQVFPGDQVRSALGPAATLWWSAVAWSDVCAGIAGVICALLAIPVAVALPISSTYSTAVDRAIALLAIAIAFSGAGSAIGRCIAIAWITPLAASISSAPLSHERRHVTALALTIWAVGAVITLLLAVALATTTRTPSSQDHIVPIYIVVVLSFPALLGVALAAEMWLGRRWRALIRSVLLAAPNLPGSIEQSFRSFAGTFMTGRMMMVGFLVGMGQFFFVVFITSFQSYYFGRLADIATICAIVAMMCGLLTWAVPVTSFTLPREEETPAVSGGLSAG